ncbi:MAG: hypothetical protein QOG31_458 [Thermoplasmata archaeon]|jgi:hypothetical protein|nr:hypothetical protein [Thermoplasmata archaeon]
MGEFRIIVPALGAIFGFQLVVAFQQSFPDLPAAARVANFVGVPCTALALLFLLVPASYHRFTPRLDHSQDFIVFAQRMGGVVAGAVAAGAAAGLLRRPRRPGRRGPRRPWRSAAPWRP